MLAYAEAIRIEIKPMDLYTINNVNETPDQITGLSYRMRPNKNVLEHQLWRFLQAPFDKKANTSLYNKNIFDWKSDVHLMGTYIFLGQDERRVFAAKDHKLLYKQIYTYDFFDVAGSKLLKLKVKIW